MPRGCEIGMIGTSWAIISIWVSLLLSSGSLFSCCRINVQKVSFFWLRKEPDSLFLYSVSEYRNYCWLVLSAVTDIFISSICSQWINLSPSCLLSLSLLLSFSFSFLPPSFLSIFLSFFLFFLPFFLACFLACLLFLSFSSLSLSLLFLSFCSSTYIYLL